MRVPIIAGNWKMHKLPDEAQALCQELVGSLDEYEDREIVVFPPFTALASSAKVLKGTNIALGAQNMFHEANGAYTGEVAPPMLVALGVKYVILGHSERRQHFAETDEIVNKKIKAALNHGLVPIVCVGETAAQREAGTTESVVNKQIRAAFDGMDRQVAQGVIVAYEPIWAIGTGKTATSREANRVIGVIRSTLQDIYGETAADIRILYGGSVNADNAAELMKQPEIDGALVGGASLDAESFARIVQYDD
ncbi:MAG: triose-phosphate isomerase [Firmicutes bacterium]|nr:triose-phosphate isomerase [Bacillota bacterium]